MRGGGSGPQNGGRSKPVRPRTNFKLLPPHPAAHASRTGIAQAINPPQYRTKRRTLLHGTKLA